MKETKYPGYYVTETGEVYSSKTNQYLNQRYTTKGYKSVELYCDGKRVYPRVHKLVAQAYIPNPLNLPEIDHDDEDKTNNNVSNLKWITSQDNNEKAHAKHYLVETPTGEVITVYNMRKYCRNNNISQSVMSRGQRSRGYKILSTVPPAQA